MARFFVNKPYRFLLLNPYSGKIYAAPPAKKR
jgi:hypothetical protein